MDDLLHGLLGNLVTIVGTDQETYLGADDRGAVAGATVERHIDEAFERMGTSVERIMLFDIQELPTTVTTLRPEDRLEVKTDECTRDEEKHYARFRVTIGGSPADPEALILNVMRSVDLIMKHHRDRYRETATQTILCLKKICPTLGVDVFWSVIREIMEARNVLRSPVRANVSFGGTWHIEYSLFYRVPPNLPQWDGSSSSTIAPADSNSSSSSSTITPMDSRSRVVTRTCPISSSRPNSPLAP